MRCNMRLRNDFLGAESWLCTFSAACFVFSISAAAEYDAAGFLPAWTGFERSEGWTDRVPAALCPALIPAGRALGLS
jgi:hypothetical protein